MSKIHTILLFGFLIMSCTMPGQDENISSPLSIRSVSGGSTHTLVLTEDGELYGWGENNCGQLGISPEIAESFPHPRLIDRGVTEISAGEESSFWIKNNGELYACGKNPYGQLGNGTILESHQPERIFENVRQVSAGSSHTLFITVENQLYAMGNNFFGQFGNGNTISSYRPVKIRDSITEVSAGKNYSFFIDETGRLFAAGLNEFGQLGTGTMETAIIPQDLGPGFTKIKAGNTHSLCLKDDGVLYGTGQNYYGQLGFDSERSPVGVWTSVTSLTSPIADFGCGNGYSFVLTTDGQVYGFGDNSSAQLGTGDTAVPDFPILIANNKIQATATDSGMVLVSDDHNITVSGLRTPSLRGIDDEVLENEHLLQTGIERMESEYSYMPFVLYLDKNQNLYFFGVNSQGFLGQENKNYISVTTPAVITNNVVDFSVGKNTAFYVDKNGSLFGAGGGYGTVYLGNGSNESSLVYVKNETLENIVRVKTNGHTLALDNENTLWGFGVNSNGQLGIGHTDNQSTPVRIAEDIRDMVTGTGQSYIIKMDNSLWGMGSNRYGQMGTGESNTDYNEPVHIAEDVSAVFSSNSILCYITNDKKLYGCGSNQYKQISSFEDTGLILEPLLIAEDVESVIIISSQLYYITTNGNLYCKGKTDQLNTGLGYLTENRIPEENAVLSTATEAIYLNDLASFILKENGDLWVSSHSIDFYGLPPFSALNWEANQ